MANDNSRSAFVPTLIVVLALVVWFAALIYEFLGERDNLAKLRQNQETTLANAQKMRGQLDAIAAGTQQLALAGNPNALQVVNALRARGITINPNAQTPPAPK